MKVHPYAEVQTTSIGTDTVVWQFSVILKGAVIGKNCNINCHTFIENNVTVGDNVTIKSGVFLWDGIEIEDNVFVGPNATFTNDKYARSKHYRNNLMAITLKKGCSIGANATILGGITIGRYSLIAAGSVVTKNVPDYALVKGNPAKITGWVNEAGVKLTQLSLNELMDETGCKYALENNKLSKL